MPLVQILYVFGVTKHLKTQTSQGINKDRCLNPYLLLDSISKFVTAASSICILLLYFVFCFSNFFLFCFDACGMFDSGDVLESSCAPPEPILNSREWIFLWIKKFAFSLYTKEKKNYLLQAEAAETLEVKTASKVYRSEYFASGLTSGKPFSAYEKNHPLPSSTFQFT